MVSKSKFILKFPELVLCISKYLVVGIIPLFLTERRIEMRKSGWTGLIMLTIIIALLVSVGCAKKGAVNVSEQKPAAVAEKSASQAQVAPEAKAAAIGKPGEKGAGVPEKEQLAESERTKIKEAAATVSPVEGFDYIYFDYDKYNIRPEYRAALGKLADWLKANSGYNVRIEGNCDERGTAEYNLALGEKRATSAMDYLKKLGVSAGNMTIISYGKERPIDPGHNEESWAKNRNDHFIVFTK